jgi:GPH family glycoside/pentoside/hexuronide:cation symporter
MAMLVGAGAIIGTMITLVAVSFQSAMADAVDEHELLFSGRREGLYFASLSFAPRPRWAGVAGLGHRAGPDPLPQRRDRRDEGAVPIAPDVLRNLGLAVGPGAALVIGASVLFFWRYRLDRAAHAEIVRKLGR